MNPFTVLGLEETADEAVRAAYLAAVRKSRQIATQRASAASARPMRRLQDHERRLALRLFGPPPLPTFEELLDALPKERRYVGPGPSSTSYGRVVGEYP